MFQRNNKPLRKQLQVPEHQLLRKHISQVQRWPEKDFPHNEPMRCHFLDAATEGIKFKCIQNSQGPFTIYVYKLRWVGGQQNVNKCKRGVGRWSSPCKRLQKYFTRKMNLNFRAKLHIRWPNFILFQILSLLYQSTCSCYRRKPFTSSIVNVYSRWVIDKM